MKKRTYVIGDIHGQLDMLKKMEQKIEAECKTAEADYEIIITGDLLDRGVCSFETYRYVKNNSKMDCLLGNHDEMWKSGAEGVTNAFYLNNGGFWTLYGLLDAVINDRVSMPEQVFEQRDLFFESQVESVLFEYAAGCKRFRSCFKEENLREIHPETSDFLEKIAAC